jgi:O-antigen/teichoic acid export membrane protein
MVKDALWVGGGQLLSILTALALNSILARSLIQTEYGIYQLAFSYLAITQIFTLPGMNTAIIKSVVKNYDKFVLLGLRRSFYGSFIGLILLIGGGLLILILKENKELGYLLLLVGGIFPIFSFEKYDAVLVGKRKFALSRKLNIGVNISSLILVGGVAFFTKNLFYTFTTACGVRMLFILLGMYLVKDIIFSKANSIKAENKKYLSFAWKQTLIVIWGIIGKHIEKVILGMLNPATLAIYHVGAMIPQRVKDNLKVLLGVPTTHWASKTKEENIYKVRKYWLLFGGIGSIVFLVIFLFAPAFIPFLFGSAYKNSVPIAIILSIPIPLRILDIMMLNINLYQEDGKVYRKIIVVALLVKLTILFLFLKKYKIWAAVASALVQDLLISILAVIYFIKKLKEVKKQTA